MNNYSVINSRFGKRGETLIDPTTFYITNSDLWSARQICLLRYFQIAFSVHLENFITIKCCDHSNQTVIYFDCSETFYNMIVRGDI